MGGKIQHLAEGGETIAIPQAHEDQGYPVIDLHTNKEGYVPHDQVTQAIQSGKYSPYAGQQVPVFSPDGKLGEVSAEQSRDAIAQGYTYASPQAAHEYTQNKKYGDSFTNTAKATALGALSGASLGASPGLLDASGLVNQETSEELAKRHPTANLVGEAAGIIGSTAYAPGASELRGAKVGLETAQTVLREAQLAKAGSAVERAAAIAKATKDVEAAHDAVSAAHEAYSTIGGADALNPTGLATKLGENAGSALGEALPDMSSTAGKVLANAMTQGLGNAVTGSLFGAGQVANEAILGDPTLNSQKIAAQIGWSGILGGGLGSILGASEVAVPAALKGLGSSIKGLAESDAVQAMKDKVGGWSDSLMSKTSGLPQDTIQAVRENRGELGNLSKTTDDYTLANKVSKPYQDLYNTTKKAGQEMQAAIKPAEAEALLAKDIKDPSLSIDAWTKTNSRINNTIEHLENLGPEYRSIASKLREYRNSYQGNPSDLIHVGEEGLEMAHIAPSDVLPHTPFDAFKSMDELKRDLGVLQSKMKGLTTADANAKDIINELRRDVKNTLQDPQIFGETAHRYASTNSAIEDYLNARKQFESKFMTKVPEKGSFKDTFKTAPTKFKSYLSNPTPERTEILQNYESAANKLHEQYAISHQNAGLENVNEDKVRDITERLVANKTEADASKQLSDHILAAKAAEQGDHSLTAAGLTGGILGHNPIVAGMAATYRAATSPYTTMQRLAVMENIINKTTRSIAKGSKSLFDTGADFGKIAIPAIGANQSKEDAEKDYKKTVNKFQGFVETPEKAMQTLGSAVDKIQQHAPNLASSLQTSALQATTFLKSKLPETQTTPLGKELPLSRSQINDFNRYLTPTENPLVAFSQMRDGTLTPQTMEALSACHSDLLGEMRESVLQQIAKKGKDLAIPEQMKNQLSLFLGSDVSMLLNNNNLQSNQAIMNQAEAEQQQKDAALQGSGPKPSATSLGKISVAQSYLTPAQKSAGRNAKP